MKNVVSFLFGAMAAIYLFTGCSFFEKEYVLNTHYHRVTAGDTIWGICEDHYAEQDRYTYFNEFVYVVRQLNKMPNRPYLQVGDVVEIPLYKEIKK